MFYFDLGRGSAQALDDLSDVKTVAQETAEEAFTGIKDFPVSVVFVYMTREFFPYEEALQSIYKTLTEKGVDLKQVPLIGGTASAVVGDEVRNRGLEVWILASDHIKVRVATLKCPFEANVEKRNKAINNALKRIGLLPRQDPARGRGGFLFTVMPGYKSLDENSSQAERLDDAGIVKYIARRTANEVRIFGSSTGDGFEGRRAPRSRQFQGNQVLRNCAVLAWVETGLKFGIGMAHGYDTSVDVEVSALVERLRGNQIQGNVVEQIGGKPAGVYLKELTERFGGDNNYLIGARRPDGSFSVAFPFTEEGEEGSAVFYPELEKWTLLKPMEVTRERLSKASASAVKRALDHANPEECESPPPVILFSSCRGRLNRIMKMSGFRKHHEAQNAEVDPIRAAWPRTHVLGVYGVGEQGLEPTNFSSTSQTWMVSTLVLLDELREEAEALRLREADKFLHQISSTESGSTEEVENAIVTQVNRLVSGQGCSLFLRSDFVPWYPHEHKSRFVLVATSGLMDRRRGGWYRPSREEITNKHWYEPGVGLTGWVAKYGVTLRISSRKRSYLKRKREELMRSGAVQKIEGEETVSPLVWRDKVKENRPSPISTSPYLAVPIKLGREVIGVVRLSEVSERARARGKIVFSSFDERVLELCSRYILSVIMLGYAPIYRETAEAVARRLGHALTSRVGLVEASLTVLENEVECGHEECFEIARDSVAFLKRAGDLSGRYWRAARIQATSCLEMGSLIKDLIVLTRDNRIRYMGLECEIYVLGDKNALENVLFEILSNAQGFVDAETGRIEVNVEHKEGFCVIDIIDNGPGVNRSLRDRLFETWAAYPDDRLGMAMSLARRVVEAHDGTIAELEPQRGAHFRVRLPLASDRTERYEQGG